MSKKTDVIKASPCFQKTESLEKTVNFKMNSNNDDLKPYP